MGQTHSSNEYNCNDAIGSIGKIQDVADSELNTNNGLEQQQQQVTNHRNIINDKSGLSAEVGGERQQHVRKLSNVSHRNIQLLSMKPRSEKDAYADGLRTRRRSSLINLILGAPSSGPRFCDDLCSLSSHISELYFGIESFPEPIGMRDSYGGSGIGIGGGNGSGRGSTSTLRLAGIEDGNSKIRQSSSQKVRRSSIGSLSGLNLPSVSDNPIGPQQQQQPDRSVMNHGGGGGDSMAPSMQERRRLTRAISRNPSLASTLASIDLTSSFEQHNFSGIVKSSHIPLPIGNNQLSRPSLIQSRQFAGQPSAKGVARARINQTSARIIHRTGSELSLYSTISASSSGTGSSTHSSTSGKNASKSLNRKSSDSPMDSICHRETKLIILLQVALPFMLAGFGNMAAGLVLDLVSQRHAFVSAPILFVLLPPLVGLKGNIEMTLASRFSTLSNLNLLQTNQQRIRAYASNLTLIISQAIGLSLFAAAISILCKLSMVGDLNSGGSGSGSNSTNVNLDQHQDEHHLNPLGLSLASTALAVFASALTTSVLLVVISSIVMMSAIALANLIQVNPDNLSTLIAAMYGDVSCVYVYGVVADWMFSLMERNLLVWPSIIVASTLILWPISLFISYKFKETLNVALYSMPPMIISILISMGSGALLSLFVGRYKLIALYQPVVNGFGANLVAVQASRVSTWLWCSALGKLPSTYNNDNIMQRPKELPSKVIGSLASFATPKGLNNKVDNNDDDDDDNDNNSRRWPLLFVMKFVKIIGKLVKKILWSFFNSTPNAIAARLLLLMLIPAHTMYFFVIWLLSAASHVVITWQFYTIYIGLCLIQVFILLTICDPFMTYLMSRNMDPDVFGISILMAVADLTGTICLTLAFFFLDSIGDVNASLH